MKLAWLRVAAVLASICAFRATPARANVLSVSNILSQFNAVVFGDSSSQSDVQGRTVVGGNLVGGATFYTNSANVAASSFSGLTVRGARDCQNFCVRGVTISGTNTVSFNLNGGGGAYIGGTNSGGINDSGTVSLNGANNGMVSLSGGTYTYTGKKGTANLNGGAAGVPMSSLSLTAPASTLPTFSSTFQAPLTELSAQLDALAANSIATSANHAITFNATPNSTGTPVFDIASSFLAPNSTVTSNLDGAESVIINLSVDSCVSTTCVFSLPNSLNFNNPTGYADTVLWNFENATGLAFTNEIGGSILAPFAAVTNNGPIDGTLVADTYSGSGELHSDPYTGTLPDGTPIPKPGSLVLIATGLAAMAGLRRRPGGSASRRDPVRANRLRHNGYGSRLTQVLPPA